MCYMAEMRSKRGGSDSSSDSGSASERRKRIGVEFGMGADGSHVADVVASLARAQGHLVVSQEAGDVDLVVVGADEPDDIRHRSGFGKPLLLVVVRRRLRDIEVKAFEGAGAHGVLDAEASLLDVAFAFSDLLFRTVHEERRYAKRQGGVDVLFRAIAAPPHENVPGRLIGLSRCGGTIVADGTVAEGTPVEICIALAGQTAAIRGRVAFVAKEIASKEDLREEIAVEFLLGDDNVAPKLCSLVGPSALGPGLPRSWV